MSSSTADNNVFPQFCEKAATDINCFKTFKQSPDFTPILEHVDYGQGLSYYKHIVLNEKITKLLDKFKVNDKLGGPKTYDYDFGTFSPTTLRYIKVLSELSQLNLEDKNIVEIGGGYGGQYTILRQYVKPKSYTFVDLPQVLKLQERYVKENKLDDITVNFYNSNNLPTLNCDLVISNYAISECNAQIQDIYISKILKNSKHGYIIHNKFEGHDIDTFIKLIAKKVKKHNETPQTGVDNILLTW
jgi:putative sugar O-methyltransferase